MSQQRFSKPFSLTDNFDYKSDIFFWLVGFSQKELEASSINVMLSWGLLEINKMVITLRRTLVGGKDLIKRKKLKNL
jgi:hypothetical protein